MTDILNNDTSHGQADRWSKWLGHLAGQPNLNFLEVGSYEGQSAIWFLRNLLNGEGSRLLCVDTWHAGEDMPYVDGDRLFTTFLNNVEPWKEKCGVMRGKSQDVLTRLEPNSFDFIYIDGSHTTPNTLCDSVLAWRLLKEGGICIWDDYLWELIPDPLLCPKTGIDAFLTCYQNHYELIAREWQVAVRKQRRDDAEIQAYKALHEVG